MVIHNALPTYVHKYTCLNMYTQWRYQMADLSNILKPTGKLHIYKTFKELDFITRTLVLLSQKQVAS